MKHETSEIKEETKSQTSQNVSRMFRLIFITLDM